jgi:lipoprotein-anchoring transpeptidase ErfK/SrfK
MIRAGGYRAFTVAGRLEPSAIRRPFSVATSLRFWRVAALTAAGTLGVTQTADAAVFWSDYNYGYAMPAPMMPQRQQRARRHSAKKTETLVKEAVKPQGPLIIAISINKQNLRIYDANGFFAETPVSTGMRGHSTPMGAFSIIQKQKYHRSNIYSGAPMPFMERITWSGIAMHAGVLPGYPASHGCIRMPMAFAVKMYGWTRMGARVVVTPGEITPTGFSHPLLVTQKVVPPLVTAEQPKADGSPSSQANRANASVARTPPVSEASLELGSSVSHAGRLQAAVNVTQAPTPLSEQTRTADAGLLPAAREAVMLSDAVPLPPPAALGDSASPGGSQITAASNDKPLEGKPTQADQISVKTVQLQAPTRGNVAKPDASVKKDEAGPSDAEKAAAAKADPAIAPKRSGPISVFISRKDAKLYVRQNFAPLFDVPVTIAPSDRPLGTHIFTAEADKTDANILRWSVISLPSIRSAEWRDYDVRVSQRRKMAGAVEIKSTPEADSPTEALDRISIPVDAMARITDALSTGGSIIVSDQGIAAGETGEGTDFIVSLR